MKYTISGNTIEEVSLSFAELVIKTQAVELVTKDKTKFAAWKLDDGGSDSFYKSLLLDPKDARKMLIQGDAPLKLAIDMRFLNLTPQADVEKAQAATKAATISRYEKQLASIETTRAKLERLRGKQ